jgi:peptide deformylase
MENKDTKINLDSTPEIVQKDTPVGDKVLRKDAEPVKESEITESKIQQILVEMKNSLATQHDGVALAAPQIGVSLQIFVVNPIVFDQYEIDDLKLTGTDRFETVFINPKIIKISKDQKKMDEGCLSVRPWYGKVKRASRATVQAMNEKGEVFTMEGTGLLAQIFQHEIDHLYGILFTDKAKDLKEIDFEEKA